MPPTSSAPSSPVPRDLGRLRCRVLVLIATFPRPPSSLRLETAGAVFCVQAARQRYRLSVAVVVQTTGFPVMVAPCAPGVEQNDPAVTVPVEAGVVVPTATVGGAAVGGAAVTTTDVGVVGVTTAGTVVGGAVVVEAGSVTGDASEGGGVPTTLLRLAQPNRPSIAAHQRAFVVPIIRAACHDSRWRAFRDPRTRPPRPRRRSPMPCSRPSWSGSHARAVPA